MENTIENNKLIAEFMGLEKQIMHGHPWFCCANADAYIPDYGLKFHSSWDWLMPVVQKVEELGYRVEISGISVRVYPVMNEKNIISSWVCGDLSKKIEITYKAVVQFITWYNSQSK